MARLGKNPPGKKQLEDLSFHKYNTISAERRSFFGANHIRGNLCRLRRKISPCGRGGRWGRGHKRGGGGAWARSKGADMAAPFGYT